MTIAPILRSLLARHKTAGSLVIVEIALTCAIVANAVFLIGERLQRIQTDSGVAERELSRVQLAGVGNQDDPHGQTREDLAALRAIPGVDSVTITNQVPFGSSSWNSSLHLDPDQSEPAAHAALYLGDADFLDTVGLRLVAGRDFRDGEFLDYHPEEGWQQMLEVDTVIITRALAERLFPGDSAVGEVLYFGEETPVRVVGVIEGLMRPTGDSADAPGHHSVLLPVRTPYTIGGSYVLRTAPSDRERVLGDATEALSRPGASRVVLEQETFEELRAEFFHADRAMGWLLLIVCGALLIVTALGIVGLASFWVQQRTRQIGVRRALGATRGQIARHFQVENLILTSAGIVLGMGLAYAINAWLMQRYELPRLSWIALPFGAVTLWALGQLSVLGPARRAAAIPPAVATRSV